MQITPAIETGKSFQAQSERLHKKLEQQVRDINRMSHMFSKRMKYVINRDLKRVVVKMIDTTTDRVIKEIPPADLQRLYVRIRQAVENIIENA